MQRLKKVVVTARAFDSTLSRLKAISDHVVCNDRTEPWTASELHAHLADADAALCFMTDTVDAPLLEASPRLKLLACALKGYDNFSLDACTSHGVAVTAVPDLLTEPTAELAVALTLGLGRRVLAGDRIVRSGSFAGWRPQLYGLGLARSTVGLLGFGAVGQATATKLAGLGVGRLLYSDPHERPLHIYSGSHAASVDAPSAQAVARSVRVQTVERVSAVDELLRMSDVLIVCTPLTSETRHLLNRHTLELANPGLLLVNISRGSCVDEAAAADALASGRLGGYAADVFELEDWALPERPRDIEPRLLHEPHHARTLFTPHLGSAVAAVREEIEGAAAQEIVRLARGEPLMNRVN